ncbi:MAG: 16S rRNA (cytosine(1402)-N(4))-methyltransferase, partial [Candidatus Omnitrophica bacterium]|nr:16S rRNA (cytosine(1402)-N(4))-methyltransferase [Candidatus Omnitrophota bacterium]
MAKDELHIPIMREEIIRYLKLHRGETVLDCTVGLGGHAEAILREIGTRGRLIGLDQDQQALDLSSNKFKGSSNCILIQANFRKIDQVLASLKINSVDGILFDLGVSSLQLETAERGFSF